MAEQAGVSEARKSFVTELAERNKTDLDRATELSRELVNRMASGEPYNLDDFVFALSMGRLRLYEEQAELLRQANEACGGRVVGVANTEGGKLWAVGIAPVEPLRLSVSNPRSEIGPGQRYRQLRASILLSHAVHSELYDISQPRLGTTEVKLLEQDGEPRLHAVKPEPVERQLLIGSDAVLEYVQEQGDKHTRSHVANFMMNLAHAAMYPEAQQA